MLLPDSTPESPTPALDGAPSADQISVVTVLYNSADVIEGLVASVPPEAELVIVDNASADDGLARARAARPDAVAIVSSVNVGFGGGCNLGWHAATRPFVAFVNPDVRLENDTLTVLLARALQEPSTMVGPKVLDGSGAPRPCKRRPSALLDLLGLLPSAARWAPAGWDGKLEPGHPVHSSGGAVDAIEGACFLLARADLEAIGGFDEDFFLYYEEDSLALRLRARGGGAIYEPHAVAAHVGAASTSKVAGMATRHLHRSRVIFYRKRDGQIRGTLSALALMLGVVVSLPASLLNAFLGRRRLNSPAHQLDVLRGLLAGMSTRTRSATEYAASRDDSSAAAEAGVAEAAP